MLKYSHVIGEGHERQQVKLEETHWRYGLTYGNFQSALHASPDCFDLSGRPHLCP